MVPITELMKYGSRRQVEAISAELDYPKANSYPEAVFEEVKRRAYTKKQSVSEKAHTAADSETVAGTEQDLHYSTGRRESSGRAINFPGCPDHDALCDLAVF